MYCINACCITLDSFSIDHNKILIKGNSILSDEIHKRQTELLAQSVACGNIALVQSLLHEGADVEGLTTLESLTSFRKMQFDDKTKHRLKGMYRRRKFIFL